MKPLMIGKRVKAFFLGLVLMVVLFCLGIFIIAFGLAYPIIAFFKPEDNTFTL